MAGSGEIRLKDLERRAATKADLAFLMELRRQTMTAHQVNAGIVPSHAERWERVLVRYECAEILSHAGRPIGLLKVARDDRDWNLIQIQLLPEFQGGGLGRALLEELIAEARAAGASIQLSVLKGSAARRLYERLGFEVLSEEAHFTIMQVTPHAAATSRS